VHLSLTTFVIEIVNFLVLIWILKRLFIGPVKRVIEERKAAVAQSLKDSEKIRSESDELRSTYENRLKDWGTEKEKERVAFQNELEAEKTKRMNRLEEDLEKERIKFRSRQEQEAAETKERIEKQAMEQALAFVSRLLSAFASVELESRIIDFAVRRLEASGPDDARALKAAFPEKGKIVVRSAFPITDDQKATLAGAISMPLGTGHEIEYSIDKSLVSGIEIELGSVVLRANLRDELQDFSESDGV
jgi:F-type H+-transporting ATPase subunit b